MKTKLRNTLLALAILVVADTSFGAVIFTNDITDANPSASNPFTTGQTFDTNITVSGIGRGAGANANAGSNRYNANSWNTAAIDLTAYFTFTLTPNTGYEIDFTNFVYTSQASNASISSFAFRSSLDSFGSDIGTPTVTGATIDLSASPFQDISAPIEFRFYAWGADTSTRTFSINDFTFNGNVTAIPEPSRALLLGLGSIGLIFRRRRQ